MSHEQPNGSRFTVPAWFVTLLKLSVPAVVAIVTMQIRVAILGKDVSDNMGRIVKLENTVDIRGEMIRSNERRISAMEIKMNFMDKTVAESLGRIEADLKDVKNDIKTIQRKAGQ